MEYKSEEELFNSLRGAFNVKLRLIKDNYSYIKMIDIWNYLKLNKWIKTKNLSISEMVNDIIDVDIEKLIEQNDDTVGWINVNNTNINYPFMQTNDNKYYLTHAFDKSWNDAGWLFLDYRNNINNNKILNHHITLLPWHLCW